MAAKFSPETIEPGRYSIDAGTAEISEDPFTAGAWLLTVNGAESSQLNPEDPTVLGFEYMRWAAAVIAHRFDPSDTRAPLRMLHLGAAGCTMARWVAALYPNSKQTAVENDAGLAALARDRFGLPRSPALRIRVAEAGEVLATARPDSRDVVMRDVFADTRTPENLTGVEAAEAAASMVGPTGVYLVNFGGGPSLGDAREEAATLTQVFPVVAAIADPAMFKGRRRGNIIFAASHAPLTSDTLGGHAGLVRTLITDPVPAHLKLRGKQNVQNRSAVDELSAFIGSAAVRRSDRFSLSTKTGETDR